MRSFPICLGDELLKKRMVEEENTINREKIREGSRQGSFLHFHV